MYMQYFLDKKRAIPAAAGFAVFLFISYFVVTRDTLTFDTVIREYLYSLRSDSLTVVFRTITYFGNKQTISIFCILLLLVPATRFAYGIPVSISTLLAVSVQYALKVSFHRARPDLALHLINQGGYSFPSGHSFSAFIFYSMLIWLCRVNIKNKTAANAVTVLLACLAAAIGISRIYLGVHYPSDVLGGWSMGLCIVMVLISGFRCVGLVRSGDFEQPVKDLFNKNKENRP